jgi:hypothetical protein
MMQATDLFFLERAGVNHQVSAGDLLGPAPTALGTDLVYVVRDGVTYQVTVADLLTYVSQYIGAVTVTADKDYIPGQYVSITATCEGNAPGILWSWEGPEGSLGGPAAGLTSLFFQMDAGDRGLYTATATCSVAYDDPQSGSCNLTEPCPRALGDWETSRWNPAWVAGYAAEFGKCTDLSSAWANHSSGVWPSDQPFPLIDMSNCTNIAYLFHQQQVPSPLPVFDTGKAWNWERAYAYMPNLTEFPVMDASAGTNFSGAWTYTALRSFPALDFSNGEAFYIAWDWTYCEDFPLVDFPKGNNFVAAWNGCRLTPQSVENVLVALDRTGKTGLDTSVKGTDLANYTPAARTAYDNLIAKGWTLNIGVN